MDQIYFSRQGSQPGSVTLQLLLTLYATTLPRHMMSTVEDEIGQGPVSMVIRSNQCFRYFKVFFMIFLLKFSFAIFTSRMYVTHMASVMFSSFLSFYIQSKKNPEIRSGARYAIYISIAFLYIL